jgi:hypothetical protein
LFNLSHEKVPTVRFSQKKYKRKNSQYIAAIFEQNLFKYLFSNDLKRKRLNPENLKRKEILVRENSKINSFSK